MSSYHRLLQEKKNSSTGCVGLNNQILHPITSQYRLMKSANSQLEHNLKKTLDKLQKYQGSDEAEKKELYQTIAEYAPKLQQNAQNALQRIEETKTQLEAELETIYAQSIEKILAHSSSDDEALTKLAQTRSMEDLKPWMKEYTPNLTAADMRPILSSANVEKGLDFFVIIHALAQTHLGHQPTMDQTVATIIAETQNALKEVQQKSTVQGNEMKTIVDGMAPQFKKLAKKLEEIASSLVSETAPVIEEATPDVLAELFANDEKNDVPTGDKPVGSDFFKKSASASSPGNSSAG